ncbi:unnamed protein product [Alopecurus aequalis]
MLRSATVATSTACGAEEEKIKKQVRRRTVAEASMGMPAVEAIAMAGFQCTPPGAGCSGDVKDSGMPPEHLRAFEAFLEKVVPVDMIMASRREEDARLRRGGKPRSYDDDMKEKLKLWAKAVAKDTMGRR